MQKYRYEQDPGHGWLGVPAAELVRLGIAGAISDCSYYDRFSKIVWLEEDCDMGIYLMAKACGVVLKGYKELRQLAPSESAKIRQFFDERITEAHVERTRIRGLPSYSCARERYERQARRATV